MKKFILLMFISLMAIGICNAQIFNKRGTRKAEKGLFGKTSGRNKSIKVREPRSVTKAKKKQIAKEKKLKKDYAKSIKESQQRAYSIQTPEVQARMKQNKKDTEARSKAKKKRVKSSSKKAGRKYK